jgi:hypothetical protein
MVQTCRVRRRSHPSKTQNIKNDELQVKRIDISAIPLATTPKIGGGIPGSTKLDKLPPTPIYHSSELLTTQHLTDLLDTRKDEQYAKFIHQLPEGWQEINDKRSTVAKRQLQMSQWGAYKDDHNTLLF